MIYKPVLSQSQIERTSYDLTLCLKISRPNPLWNGEGWGRILGRAFYMPIEVGSFSFPSYQNSLWKRGNLPTFNLDATPPIFTCLKLNLILIR